MLSAAPLNFMQNGRSFGFVCELLAATLTRFNTRPIQMQLLLDLPLQVEERAESGKASNAFDGSDKLVYFCRLPTGELATLDYVFSHFSKVALSSGVL
jgi:hypothetical protein